ncbi:hypothetical protein DFR76_109388 [Nocardia pseudobrasiliensis]|uniref:Uncharacterized protein n=2 Tax=Nocardia pseudobrasiliensis TaxID=45979 RepID=A0A370HZW4_9NOCA|nr:hypothetical protein DFR76_109388 [Nocardia pseudobrasiliensis]
MTSQVRTPFVAGELHGMKYQPVRKIRLDRAAGTAVLTAPYVEFQVGDARVMLLVEDARDLLEALPNVLAQHDYAEYLSDTPRLEAV